MLEWQGNPEGRVTKNDASVYNAPSPLTSLPVFLVFLAVFYWLCWVFIAACGLSLIAARRVYSVDEVHRLLIEVVSLSTDCRVWAQQLWHMGLAALWCVEYSWMKDQTYDLHCRSDFLTT